MTDLLYHAFVKLKGSDTFRVLGLDLSSDDLKKKICKPYKAGKDIVISSAVTSISDVQQLVIVRSAQAAKEELSRISNEHDALIKRENGKRVMTLATLSWRASRRCWRNCSGASKWSLMPLHSIQ